MFYLEYDIVFSRKWEENLFYRCKGTHFFCDGKAKKNADTVNMQGRPGVMITERHMKSTPRQTN